MTASAESGDPAAVHERVALGALRAVRARRQLELVRSYEIPSDDPDYERLSNWSWTYDSALASTAFTADGDQDQAGRLLDQLAALQRKDGSIEFAFDVSNGQASGTVRAGSLAFAALAFTDYDSTFDSHLYLDNARAAIDYLLALRDDRGLIAGGPDVSWVSTQHNILTVMALTGLSNELADSDPDAAARYREVGDELSKAIETQLLVGEDGQPGEFGGILHFNEGLDDQVVPLDTQALGILFAINRGDTDLAKRLYEFAQKNFAIEDRSIELSKDPATYNMTYQADGPFTGYRPYLGEGAPDVMWFEGTAEMRLASAALGQSPDPLDKSMNAWWEVTRDQGLAPLGADRTVTHNDYNEYHVWPTAAAGAWTILSRLPGRAKLSVK